MMRGIEGQRELWQWSATPVPFVASFLLAFALLGGVSLWTWKHPPIPDRRTPRDRAVDEIKAIEATPHLETGDVKMYCIRVSNTLREYLTRACDISAHEMTTGELAQTLKQDGTPPQVAAQIIYVLKVCDTVKFANDLSDMDAIKTLTSIAQQIVLIYPVAGQNEHTGEKRG